MTEVKYDLDLNSKPCRGVLRYENGAVYALEDDKEVFSHSLENVGELVQYTDVGCGSIEISPFADEFGSDYDSAENITVCRFSMSAAEDIGEFCKAVNHYIKTGEEPQLSTDNADRCPVCGRRYPKGTDVCMFCHEPGLYRIRSPERNPGRTDEPRNLPYSQHCIDTGYRRSL